MVASAFATYRPDRQSDLTPVNNRYSVRSGIARKYARPLSGFMRQSQGENEPPDEHLPAAVAARGSTT